MSTTSEVIKALNETLNSISMLLGITSRKQKKYILNAKEAHNCEFYNDDELSKEHFKKETRITYFEILHGKRLQEPTRNNLLKLHKLLKEKYDIKCLLKMVMYLRSNNNDVTVEVNRDHKISYWIMQVFSFWVFSLGCIFIALSIVTFEEAKIFFYIFFAALGISLLILATSMQKVTDGYPIAQRIKKELKLLDTNPEPSVKVEE